MTRLMTIIKAGVLMAGVLFAGALTADDNEQAPLQLAQLTEGFDAQASYMATCFACHNSGAGGAPNPNNADDWTARMEQGMDAMMNNVINGVNAMPAKGLCFNCTNEDLRAIVDYMLEVAGQ